MAISVDDEVRAAALTQIRRLRDLYGGRIRRDALMEGVTVSGQRVPIRARVGITPYLVVPDRAPQRYDL
jgi:hypothetical protein